MVSLLPGAAAGASPLFLLAIAFTTVKELTNEIFQHHRRLSVLNCIAILQDRNPVPGLQNPTFNARYCSPAGRKYECSANWYLECGYNVVQFPALRADRLRVQRNIRHPTHNNATNTDRRARFQAANVIERRIKRVGRFSTYGSCSPPSGKQTAPPAVLLIKRYPPKFHFFSFRHQLNSQTSMRSAQNPAPEQPETSGQRCEWLPG